jgi:hypothetical protein
VKSRVYFSQHFSMKDLLMKLQLLLAGILLVLLAACSPPPNLRDPNMWHDESLVTGEPCAAPCWQGITPGETTWTEAQAIISTLSGAIDLQIQEQDGQVGGIWRSEASQDYCCAVVSVSGDAIDATDVVNYIQVRLAPDMTLGELIEAIGEPTYLINGEEVSEDQAYIVLLYPDIPVIVYAFVAGAASGALNASSEIVFAVYLTPEAMADEVIATSSLQAWDGYQSYSYYAESEANPYEVTPEATSEATSDATEDASTENEATATVEATSENEATEAATSEADATEAP